MTESAVRRELLFDGNMYSEDDSIGSHQRFTLDHLENEKGMRSSRVETGTMSVT